MDMSALHTTGSVCCQVGMLRDCSSCPGCAIHVSVSEMCSDAVSTMEAAAIVATTTDINGRADPSLRLVLWCSVRKICRTRTF